MTLPIFLGKTLLPLLLRGLYLTLRKQVSVKTAPLPDPKNGLIFAFWHGKMLTGWLQAKSCFPKTQFSAIISLSKDGEILAGALKALNFHLIRGSSSRGKESVKEEMRKALDGGQCIAVTPDGPRGPREVFKYGTLRLASEAGKPLVFAQIRHENYWQLRKSWDKFEIPKPFSEVRIELFCIHVPKFASESELKTFAETQSAKFGNQSENGSLH
ncbi:MAG: lysophospholipid acyltransferase family protein [Chlorobiales bacterium]|nr:lysophospholipid acyltransferase family protein [Chlorobiales bacterium]